MSEVGSRADGQESADGRAALSGPGGTEEEAEGGAGADGNVAEAGADGEVGNVVECGEGGVVRVRAGVAEVDLDFAPVRARAVRLQVRAPSRAHEA